MLTFLLVAVWAGTPLLAAILVKYRGVRSLSDTYVVLLSFPVAAIIIMFLPIAVPASPPKLKIDQHIGNLVTISAFGAACLYAYIGLPLSSLQHWLSEEALLALKLRDITADKIDNLRKNFRDHNREIPVATTALLQLTAMPADEVEAKNVIRSVCSGWELGVFTRGVLLDRFDLWVAGAGLWLMVYICGQSLILFTIDTLSEAVEKRLCNIAPWFPDVAIWLGYIVALMGIFAGVLLLRWAMAVRGELGRGLRRHADELSNLVFAEGLRPLPPAAPGTIIPPAQA